jgi:3-oxoacyl-[acyl-carrier-protein] synthase III
MLNISVAFPDKVFDNSELQKLNPEYNFPRLEKKLGIKSRYVCSDTESAFDIAVKACNSLFENYDKSKIDFIIYCTQSPEYFLPTTACVLQNKLDLNTNCGAFDFNLGCSGYIYGLSMAKAYIQSGIAENILLVTAEAYSKHLHKDDLTNRAIFGDAATATVIDKEFSAKIGSFNLGSDGSGAENLIVKSGAGKSSFKSGDSKEDLFYMNGPEVFQFTLNSVPKSVEDCLSKNEASKSDVDFFIFHQANKYMLSNLRKKIGIDEDKFYVNVEETGNTVSSTIPIALAQSLESGLIKVGDSVLLCGFGVGYSWGSTIIKF